MQTPSVRPISAALLLAALAALLSLLTAGTARADDTVELLVRRDAGLTAAERLDVRQDAGVSFDRRLRLADAEVVTVPAAEAPAALQALRADPDVRWAQPNGEVRAAAAGTTDPYFGLQYALRNTGQAISGTAGVADADMDVVEAWPRSTGAGVTVAVVDSGVDLAHPDLAGQIALNPGEMGDGKEANGVDDDGDGLVDDWQGWDFVQGDNVPQDGDGHGTHVAGTIAALNGNGAGVSGVAPDARVLVLRALDDTGNGTWADVADAFDLAGDLGIPIVNASLGAAGSVQAITDVIVQHPNTLYVVAAGNDGKDIEPASTTYFPCEAPAPNVVCVGASDQSDARASFSNFGPTAVDLFAPGRSILAPTGGGYYYMSGTSMATPDVVGVAALVKSAHQALTAAQLKAALLAGAEAKPALSGLAAFGRANAVASLDAAAGLPPTPAPPADTDGDGVADPDDQCPLLPGPASNRGCPVLDGDGDGVENGLDHCPTVPAPTGDGCPVAVVPPPTPAPEVPATPATPAAPLSGTPSSPAVVPSSPSQTPAAGPARPAVVSATARVQRCVRHRPCRNRLTMTVRARAAMSVSLDVTVRRCSRGRCRWVAVTGRTARVSTTAARVTLSRLLAAGRYRVRVVAHGARGDSAAVSRSVTIRR
jgi:thermitase